MTTLKLTIVLLLFSLAGCAQTQTHSKKHAVNTKARQLNDSAMTLIRSMKDEDYQKAILLFDEAIKIDSDYTLAYWNKLSCQRELKQYSNAIETAKQINRLNNSPYFYFTIATFYYRLGDTVAANDYFKQTLAVCDNMLDTMSKKNKSTYEVVIMNKGVSLIFLGQPEDGNRLLRRFYDSQSDSNTKIWIASFMNKSKEQILAVLEGEN